MFTIRRFGPGILGVVAVLLAVSLWTMSRFDSLRDTVLFLQGVQVGTLANASVAPGLPAAPDCTVCSCTQLQPICTARRYSGCADLCKHCKFYITGSRCETT